MKLERIYTALVTPFDEQMKIDFYALEKLVENLYQKGMRGFLIGGTTGEAPALKREEKELMVRFIKKMHPDISIMLGVGTNDTEKSKEDVIYFNQIDDIDAYLIVVPYYNRPSQEGIYAHFMTLDIASKRPIILYNVPARCGTEINFDTLSELIFKTNHIIGLKQASSDLEMIEKIKAIFPDFIIYSGEDGKLLEALYAGADGVISVVSHVIPLSVLQMVQEFDACQNLEPLDDYIKLIAKYCFSEPSPAPVKYLLFKQGLIKNILRLPLVPIPAESEEKFDRLINVMKTF